ncbi:MAG TPA: class III signal peptide-containing protein, partial [Methanothermococcus okinawensis]|nr:class III signal peptide-containing protein [Methanothermococcus okinawensis]
MKFINNNKGQTSIELFILILAVVLGGVMVASNMSISELNTTGVQDSKKVAFGGFIHGGGTPVLSGENDSNAGDDNNNTTSGGNDSNAGEDNNNTTNTGGGIAGSLELKLNGNSISYITSDVIPGGESISGDIGNITILGNKIEKFNV